MWEDVRRCEKMWEDVRRCEKMRRCEDEKMWEDVKMRRCEDEKMWEDVRRCEKMWRWEDEEKMRRRWEDEEKMRRWGEDVRMRRCKDEKMWRWEDEKMRRRCGDEKMWRSEDVKMRRCFTDPHYWKNPALRRSREKLPNRGLLIWQRRKKDKYLGQVFLDQFSGLNCSGKVFAKFRIHKQTPLGLAVSVLQLIYQSIRNYSILFHRFSLSPEHLFDIIWHCQKYSEEVLCADITVP